MPVEIEKELADQTADAGDTAVDENPNRAERIDDRHPRDRVAGKEPGRDLRSIIKGAVKETRKAAETDGRPVKDRPAPIKEPLKDGGVASPDVALKDPKAEIGKDATGETPQAASTVAAPSTAPKEVAAIWDKLSPEHQTIFAKREADMLKGVEQLKSKYKPLDDAFAPVADQLRGLGKTHAEAASQLIQWQSALANPRTQAQAFVALARAHNFDLSRLTAQQAPAGAPNPQTDPNQAFRSMLDPLQQEVVALKTENQRREVAKVQGDIASFSKDKPHFERVRVVMGHLINDGLVPGDSPASIFDEAYKMACRANPEVFDDIQREEQTKRDADAKAASEAAAKKAAEDAEAKRKRDAEAVAKARKAGVGPRGGSPGMAIAATSRGESARDTIKNAIRDASARA